MALVERRGENSNHLTTFTGFRNPGKRNQPTMANHCLKKLFLSGLSMGNLFLTGLDSDPHFWMPLTLKKVGRVGPMG